MVTSDAGVFSKEGEAPVWVPHIFINSSLRPLKTLCWFEAVQRYHQTSVLSEIKDQEWDQVFLLLQLCLDQEHKSKSLVCMQISKSL